MAKRNLPPIHLGKILAEDFLKPMGITLFNDPTPNLEKQPETHFPTKKLQ